MSRNVLCAVSALTAALVVINGCSMLTPGLDTRVASEANSTTTWDEKSNLQLKESTTHNRKVLAAEGESMEIEYFDTGVPKKVTGATHVLSQISEPRDVMEAYAKLAGLNLEMGREIVGLIKQVAPKIFEQYAPSNSTPTNPGGVNYSQMFEALPPEARDVILQQLRERFPLFTIATRPG